MSAEATLKTILTGEDRSAGKTMRGVGNDADRAGSKFQKMGKLAKAGGVALAGAAVVAAGAAVKLAQMAAEDEVSAKRLERQLKNSAKATKGQIDATEDWISAVGRAKGVADDDLRPALGRLVAVTGSVSKAQKLTSLGMNIAAGTGKSLTAVTTALAKAQTGTVGGLARLGAKTKDAEGKTRSLRDITRDLAKTYKGQAAEAANTTAGKYERLKLMATETAESLGYKLLPLALKVANVLMYQVAPAAMEAATWLGDKLGPSVTKVAAWFTGSLLPAVTKVINWIKSTVIPVVRDLAQKWFASVSEMVDRASSSFSDLEPFIQLVIAAAKGLWNIFSGSVLPVLTKIWQTALPALGSAFDKIIDVIALVGKAGIWLWNNIFQPVFSFLASGIGTVLSMFARLVSAMSHVPGFGWAKDLANELDGAASKANKVASGLKKIDQTDPRVDISVKASLTPATQQLIRDIKRWTKGNTGGGGATDFAGLLAGGRDATGDRYSSGGMRLVGERGPELVDMARGSRVYTADETGRMMGAGGGGGYGDLGTLTLDITQDGVVIARKLAKLKRDRGGARLEFEA